MEHTTWRIIDAIIKNGSQYADAIEKISHLTLDSTFTALDLDLSGATLKNLADEFQLLDVVGQEETFICLDVSSETYKKVCCNIYKTTPAFYFVAEDFSEKLKAEKIERIENKISNLKRHLEDALYELNKIEKE